MRKSYLLIISFLCLTLFFGLGLNIQANEFPDEPVDYIIPFDPGGESDITARQQEPLFEEITDQDLVISYTSGGGGAIGWSQVQSMDPNPYTIVGVNLPHIITQPIEREDPGYDTFEFSDIIWFQYTPNALAVHEDSEIEDLDDYIEHAREYGEAFTIGGSGSYTADHIGAMTFADMIDADTTYIPYSGSGAAVPALLGDHVSALMTSTPVVLGNDEIRALAVAAEERVPGMEEIPTFEELGYDYIEGEYRGVAAPPGTDEEYTEALYEIFSEINEHPEFKEFYEQNGFINISIGPDESEEFLRDLQSDYKDFMKESGN